MAVDRRGCSYEQRSLARLTRGWVDGHRLRRRRCHSPVYRSMSRFQQLGLRSFCSSHNHVTRMHSRTKIQVLKVLIYLGPTAYFTKLWFKLSVNEQRKRKKTHICKTDCSPKHDVQGANKTYPLQSHADNSSTV